MKKILHLTHTYIPEDSRILKEIKSAEDLGFHVFGIGVTHLEKNKSPRPNCRFSKLSINIHSRNIFFVPKTVRHVIEVLEITVKMLIKAIKIKPDIIHCSDTSVLPLGVLAKLITRSKLVYDAHELESNRNSISKLSSWLTFRVESILWKSIDALIVVSPSIELWYKENIGKKNSTVILNAPVLEKNATITDNQYLRKYFSISKSSKIFLYVGILGHGRGIDVITQAFMSSSLNSSLVFLGFGELSDELKELAQKYPNIYVHASVPHEQVVSVAKSADVGLCLIQNVSLSDYYCLPNKLFEYCFAGIPVLASDFPDISRVVTKYSLGKCCKLDFDSIFKAIQEFENMNELPKVNTDELYDLSWGAQEDKLIKLYNNIIQ